MRIDSHQHFWRYNPAHHVWMTEEMKALRRDFLPEELKLQLQTSRFDGTIAVQARQLPEETDWLLQLASLHPFIKGVVGWVDLCSPNLPLLLRHFVQFTKLRGVRHVVHDEPDDNFMLGPKFLGGIAQLRKYGLTYDLLVFPRHLPVAVKLVREFPQQMFVLDHIGKPAIRESNLATWQKDEIGRAHV